MTTILLWTIVPLAIADSLPLGTTVSTDFNNLGDFTYFNSEFTEPGSQTIFFPQAAVPLEAISINVTTYVENAVFYFTIDGIEYSMNVTPNTNYLLTFASPLKLKNVHLSISDRGYPDDATNSVYFPHVQKCWDENGDGTGDIPPYFLGIRIYNPDSIGGEYTGNEDKNGDGKVNGNDCK